MREALRGRRRVLRVWGLEAEVAALEAPATVASIASGEALERLCGSPDHQGLVAEVEPYPYADPGSLLEPEDAREAVRAAAEAIGAAAASLRS